MRILVIEDEYNLADAICTRIKKEKYTVDMALDGEEGLDNALSDIYDLIVLDIMLPKVDGIEILRQIKANKIKSKVIMLTAKSELEDKLLGFDNGANDYVTKPFHIEELIARINAQLRIDSNQNLNKYIEFGDLRLDIKKSSLLCSKTGESIDIVCKEFLLLEYFMKNPNQIISKEQIYDKIWGIDNTSLSNNLEAYLSFVRKKLKVIGSSVNIKAIRGLGYRIEE
ncbi:MAG: response regulator transcription factor [Bacilli bacterium]